MIYVFSVLLSFASAYAAENGKDGDVAISGKILFEPKTKPGAAYLMVSTGSNSDLIKPKLEESSVDTDPKREVLPQAGSFQGYLSVGSASGESHSFSVDLPPGKYQISAFIKNGAGDGPKCIVVPRENRQVAISCFPTKGDTVCSGESVTVGKDKDFVIHCGSPVGEPTK